MKSLRFCSGHASQRPSRPEADHGLFTVVDRVVHLVAEQLIILYEPVIGTFRKEQGREVERVDQPPRNLSILKEVFGIVVDDVVTTEILHTLEEG